MKLHVNSISEFYSLKKSNLRNFLFHSCDAKTIVTTMFINNVCICYFWKNDIITIFMMAKEIQFIIAFYHR